MKKHTDSAISKLTDKIRNLNANFKRLESNVQVCKKVNDALLKQAVSLERKCWRNALCSRRKSVEIWGMSNWIVDDALEKTVYKGLQHIGTDICEEKPSQQKKQSDYSENTRRKDYEQLTRIKKDLKDLNTIDLDFPEVTRLFINDTRCPYYRVLWKKHKKLCIKKKKNDFWIKNMGN